MSEIPRAIFLSYASQDAQAAREACEALRAAGLEVWFDQSELRGGDAWDASIRRQVRECALFVPFISANTDSRSEGYFRLEWRLAVERSQLMADDRAFLLPVVLDDTPEATARVPDRFRERQWMRLAGEATTAAFVERVMRLLSGIAPPARGTAASVQATPAAAAGEETPSIAVLPFVNLSRSEENEYFADGLAEELLSVLAKIRGLRVASRTSAFSFKGKDVDIPTVARKLNVANVLEGSVRASGKRVRISAQLIRAADDSHLWSQSYDRELEDIFAVQDDIAHSVVKELRAALFGEGAALEAGASVRAEVRAAAVGRTDDAQAYRLYLQGRFFLERLTEADVAKSVGYFQQATAIDPGFALAWTGLSCAFRWQGGYGWLPFAEGFEKAREAAQRALALVPDLVEGHLALGFVHSLHDFNWKAADAEFRRALALAPDNAEVLRAIGELAGQLGRLDESIEANRRQAALDPLSTTSHRMLGQRYEMAGRYAEAAAALEAALDLNPQVGLVHKVLSVVRLRQGRAAEALEIAEREPIPFYRLVTVALAEHSLGNAGKSDAAMQKLIEEFGEAGSFQYAEICAWRGRTDEAFRWLECAYVQRDPGLAWVAVGPLLESLHGDSRWAPFLRKMGLAG